MSTLPTRVKGTVIVHHTDPYIPEGGEPGEPIASLAPAVPRPYLDPAYAKSYVYDDTISHILMTITLHVPEGIQLGSSATARLTLLNEQLHSDDGQTASNIVGVALLNSGDYVGIDADTATHMTQVNQCTLYTRSLAPRGVHYSGQATYLYEHTVQYRYKQGDYYSEWQSITCQATLTLTCDISLPMRNVTLLPASASPSYTLQSGDSTAHTDYTFTVQGVGASTVCTVRVSCTRYEATSSDGTVTTLPGLYLYVSMDDKTYKTNTAKNNFGALNTSFDMPAIISLWLQGEFPDGYTHLECDATIQCIYQEYTKTATYTVSCELQQPVTLATPQVTASSTVSTITLTWPAVDGATSYLVESRTNNNEPTTSEVTDATYSTTVSNTKFFRVKAQSATGVSEWSDCICVQYQYVKCEKIGSGAQPEFITGYLYADMPTALQDAYHFTNTGHSLYVEVGELDDLSVFNGTDAQAKYQYQSPDYGTQYYRTFVTQLDIAVK